MNKYFNAIVRALPGDRVLKYSIKGNKYISISHTFRRAMSTKEVNLYLEFRDKELTAVKGDVIAYGDWYDIDPELLVNIKEEFINLFAGGKLDLSKYYSEV